jgi:serine/threonine protein kinase
LTGTCSDPRQSPHASHTKFGVPQLADFGLSRILEGDQQTHVVTQTYGTACFMPPELLKSGHLSAAADVYSFAIIMYQLFTCKV